MLDKSLTELRLTLRENGYSPLPNLDKRCLLPEWPTVEINTAKITRWGRSSKWQGAGLRVENGLAVTDIDINLDAATAEALADALLTAVPALGDAPVRFGNGHKEAWFVRSSELFSRLHYRSWIAPGQSVDEGAHRIEIFGGASSRQFGAFGPHTVGDDGVVAIRYEWHDSISPATVPLSELPELTKEQFILLVDTVERILRERGWEPIARTAKGESDAARVYDLTEDMSFDLDDGRTVLLPELREIAAGESGVRCSASWLEGNIAVNRSRCLVTQTRDGKLAIYETAEAQTHLEKAFAPIDIGAKTKDFAKALKRIGVGQEAGAPVSTPPEAPQASQRGAFGAIDRTQELRVEKDAHLRYKIGPGDDASIAAAKLLETMAFCPTQANSVIPIWTTDLAAGIHMTAFRTLMLPNKSEEVGPRGGRISINPVDIWVSDSRRKTVAGVRLRPDKPRPLYEEDGELWINCYKPPNHPERGGSADVGVEFLTQLLPVEAERTWFIRWLSYKYQRPDIPGPAVVMVARKFGTGRGTLGKLIKRLFGNAYVSTIPFGIFAGRNSQSQYTDWQVSSLMVLVNESSEAEAGLTRYSTRASTYEHLKETVDPSPISRVFIAKGRPAFTATSAASFIIATNNIDALPIPEDDRRFAVLTNGEQRDVVYWEQLIAGSRTLRISAHSPGGYSKLILAATRRSQLLHSHPERSLWLRLRSPISTGQSITVSAS